MVGLDSAFFPEAFRQAIVATPDTELVGMCGLGLTVDVIERDFVAPVDEWLRDRGTVRIATIDELMERDFEAAFICSRSTVMPPVAERLLKAGKHLFVAKPMAVDPVDADRYLRGGSLVVTAGQLASTWEPWPTMLRLADEGRVGRVLSMRAVHQHGHYRDFPAQLWYSDPAEGDACNWLGWYPVEAVVAAMGEVAAVSGVARQTASAHGSMPDQIHAVLELADGRVATAEALFTVGPWGMAMHEGQIVGERGIIRSEGPAHEVQVLTDAGIDVVRYQPGDGLVCEVAAFLAAVRGDGQPAITAARAVHVSKVCMAWRRSAAAGTRVAL